MSAPGPCPLTTRRVPEDGLESGSLRAPQLELLLALWLSAPPRRQKRQSDAAHGLGAPGNSLFETRGP